MNFGRNIAELRKKNNLSQEDLAEKVKVTRQTISKWELNETVPDIKQARVLASIFKISLDDLADFHLEVNCSKKSILTNLIGKECYLDIDCEDYRLANNTLCKIIDINNNYIKVEFMYRKETITKLLGMDLISSIKCIKKKEGKI